MRTPKRAGAGRAVGAVALVLGMVIGAFLLGRATAPEAVTTTPSTSAAVSVAAIVSTTPSAATASTTTATAATQVVTTPPPTTAAEQRFTLTGSLEIDVAYSGPAGNQCTGLGTLSDVSAGMTIAVKNEAGAVVGRGALQSGRQMALQGTFVCVFPFSPISVTKADGYTVDLGQRGSKSYSFDGLSAKGWHVEYFLGA